MIHILAVEKPSLQVKTTLQNDTVYIFQGLGFTIYALGKICFHTN